MRRGRFLSAAILMGLLLLPALTTQARVFRLIGRWWGGAGPDAGESGESIYRTVMRVNSGEAEVNVRVTPKGTSGELLRQDRGTAGMQPVDETTARQVRRDSSGDRHGIALRSADGEGPSVFVSVEPLNSAPAALRMVPRHELSDIPLVPGGVVSAFIRNAQSRTALEMAATGMAPTEAAAFYESTMKRSGWVQLFHSPAGEGPVLLCFVRNLDFCCVQVGPVNTRGETQLALLHRQGALN